MDGAGGIGFLPIRAMIYDILGKREGVGAGARLWLGPGGVPGRVEFVICLVRSLWWTAIGLSAKLTGDQTVGTAAVLYHMTKPELVASRLESRATYD